MRNVLCEICVESLEGALVAQEAGADRIELCSSLSEGGLTPSAGLLQLVHKSIALPIHVMIRPRRGDFVYTSSELDTMMCDIAYARELGAAGIVLGLLRVDGTVDEDKCARLIQMADPLSVTFHRAFDFTRDPFEALETLRAIGVARILTSGCAPSVDAGIETLTRLITRAGSRIGIMPGGGIHELNVAHLVRTTDAQEIHFSGRASFASPMTFRNESPLLAHSESQSHHVRDVTDPNRIRTIVAAARQ
ncbi:MAG: copper homeostasis protein CutC [bacterium]|nr:copper homeostasis protein CutC [bacterium]